MTREELARERAASAERQALKRHFAAICKTAANCETEILDAIAARIDAIDAELGAEWANRTFAEIAESDL
jgi:hypothetical protein